MRTLAILLVTLIGPLSALAQDRTWNLTGTERLTIAGFGSETLVATATLTLLATGFYTLTVTIEGQSDDSSGVWIEERNRIQLFQEDPLPSVVIAELEAALSAGLGQSVRLTELKQLLKMKVNTKTGELRVTGKDLAKFRPGPKGTAPLRVSVRLKLAGPGGIGASPPLNCAEDPVCCAEDPQCSF